MTHLLPVVERKLYFHYVHILTNVQPPCLPLLRHDLGDSMPYQGAGLLYFLPRKSVCHAHF